MFNVLQLFQYRYYLFRRFVCDCSFRKIAKVSLQMFDFLFIVCSRYESISLTLGICWSEDLLHRRLLSSCMRIFRVVAPTAASFVRRVLTPAPASIRRFWNCPKLSESRAQKRRTSLGPQRRVGRSRTALDLSTTCTDALLRPRGNGSHSRNPY